MLQPLAPYEHIVDSATLCPCGPMIYSEEETIIGPTLFGFEIAILRTNIYIFHNEAAMIRRRRHGQRYPSIVNPLTTTRSLPTTLSLMTPSDYRALTSDGR